MTLSKQISESLTPLMSVAEAALKPTTNISAEGKPPIYIHDIDEIKKWVQSNKSQLITLSKSDVAAIEKRLKAAEPKWVTGDNSATFMIYEKQPYILKELGAPGMNRTMTIEHVVTGKVSTVPLGITRGVYGTFCLGISEVTAKDMFPRVEAIVQYLEIKNSNSYKLYEGHTETTSTDPIDVSFFEKYKTCTLVPR